MNTSNTNNEQMYRLRHSTAHIMAQAVTEMFAGEIQIAIGPPIENGFYYDFELPRSLTDDDLPEIEKRMKKIIAGNHDFVRTEVDILQAQTQFAKQKYKLELIDDIQNNAEMHTDNDNNQSNVTFFSHDTFTDLCKGPHIDNTKEINPKALKLLSVAGAYWRGDSKNTMLQRIYGTIWNTPKELRKYLWTLEEAKKRDHRKIGTELGLFYFSSDIGPGLPLFTPKGETIRNIMESYVRDIQTKYGYKHVWTGHIVKEDLYKKSGHYDNYEDSMFPAMIDSNIKFRLKPMNCPSHMTLYKEMGKHSYRDLPIRFAEFATLYRYEKSGELTGLTRVRSLTQDDCHIFCTPNQIQEEFTLALNLIQEVLSRYQFTDYKVRLSLRDDDGKYVKDDAKWKTAEKALKSALDSTNIDYYSETGEAAFYGPKADFIARDVLGREWQLSTIQVDFIQPDRLGLTYHGEDGEEHTPVVLHRAVTGSTERFLGVVIEQYAGSFPLWLSPVQTIIIPITDRNLKYCDHLYNQLNSQNIRVEIDSSSERMNAKIRKAQVQKIPYMLIVGDKEEQNNSVSVRSRSGDNIGTKSLEEFLNIFNEKLSAGD
ncbi:MAG TPA: threonine--tRNA ligase [Chloroflexi bacterium]|nr:threonine--tRNA ligase [Chloroflexota bacterium]|tara:strand:+ start:163 stop:1950 length:1788 start_codon:yes stop_codon:yes gene_type:complete